MYNQIQIVCCHKCNKSMAYDTIGDMLIIIILEK